MRTVYLYAFGFFSATSCAVPALPRPSDYDGSVDVTAGASFPVLLAAALFSRRLSVCLFCLLEGCLKKLWADFHEI